MLNEYVIAKMIFMTIQENSSIHGIEPFYQDKNMNSMLKCFLLCQQQHDRCLFVEVSTSQNDTWSSRLFDLNEDVGQYLVPLPDSVVSAPRSMRCCLNWRYQEFAKNGVYYISRFQDSGSGKKHKKQKVYCDMTTDGGGWIVIQRRIDGSVNFNRGWSDYKNGFGDVNGEYWLGNEFVHQYTKSQPLSEMMVEAEMFNGNAAQIRLNGFRLDAESTG